MRGLQSQETQAREQGVAPTCVTLNGESHLTEARTPCLWNKTTFKCTRTCAHAHTHTHAQESPVEPRSPFGCPPVLPLPSSRPLRLPQASVCPSVTSAILVPASLAPFRSLLPSQAPPPLPPPPPAVQPFSQGASSSAPSAPSARTQFAVPRNSVWRQSPPLPHVLSSADSASRAVFTAGKGPERVGFNPGRSTEAAGCI